MRGVIILIRILIVPIYVCLVVGESKRQSCGTLTSSTVILLRYASHLPFHFGLLCPCTLQCCLVHHSRCAPLSARPCSSAVVTSVWPLAELLLDLLHWWCLLVRGSLLFSTLLCPVSLRQFNLIQDLSRAYVASVSLVTWCYSRTSATIHHGSVRYVHPPQAILLQSQVSECAQGKESRE